MVTLSKTFDLALSDYTYPLIEPSSVKKLQSQLKSIDSKKDILHFIQNSLKQIYNSDNKLAEEYKRNLDSK